MRPGNLRQEHQAAAAEALSYTPLPVAVGCGFSGSRRDDARPRGPRPRSVPRDPARLRVEHADREPRLRGRARPARTSAALHPPAHPTASTPPRGPSATDRPRGRRRRRQCPWQSAVGRVGNIGRREGSRHRPLRSRVPVGPCRRQLAPRRASPPLAPCSQNPLSSPSRAPAAGTGLCCAWHGLLAGPAPAARPAPAALPAPPVAAQGPAALREGLERRPKPRAHGSATPNTTRRTTRHEQEHPP